jgi:hypothetical protein
MAYRRLREVEWDTMDTMDTVVEDQDIIEEDTITDDGPEDAQIVVARGGKTARQPRNELRSCATDCATFPDITRT